MQWGLYFIRQNQQVTNILFIWWQLLNRNNNRTFFVLTTLQGIKSLWSRTQANRRSHFFILASKSFYGDRMKEQALDKPADGFLQFLLHLHTFGCETTDYFHTVLHTNIQQKARWEISAVFSAEESSRFTWCCFISDKQGKEKVWLLMLLRLVKRPQLTSQITQDNI